MVKNGGGFLFGTPRGQQSCWISARVANTNDNLTGSVQKRSFLVTFRYPFERAILAIWPQNPFQMLDPAEGGDKTRAKRGPAARSGGVTPPKEAIRPARKGVRGRDPAEGGDKTRAKKHQKVDV